MLKRFMFRKTGKVFMYQSSVPDEVYETPQSDLMTHLEGRVRRVTQVMELVCFEIIGKDVIVTIVSQTNTR